MEHTATIYSGAAFVQLQNDVDIRETYNFEVAMRLITSVKSGDTFFTDLNGYQVGSQRVIYELYLAGHRRQPVIKEVFEGNLTAEKII